MEPFDTSVVKRTLVQVWAVIAIAAILGTFIIAYHATYASVAGLDNRAGGRWAEVAGDLVDRYSGIPSLLTVLSQYQGPDAPPVQEVNRRFAAWKGAFISGGAGQVSRATSELEASLAQVRVFLEGNPEMASTGEAREFLAALAGTNEEIREDRLSYNEAVDEYNHAISTFPATLWSGNWGFVPREYFMAEPGNG
jgi:LemA protein